MSKDGKLRKTIHLSIRVTKADLANYDEQARKLGDKDLRGFLNKYLLFWRDTLDDEISDMSDGK
jgi:hypothetical protein